MPVTSAKNAGLSGSMPGFTAANALGLGDLLTDQRQQETEEQRRRRLLLQMQQEAMSPLGAASSLGAAPIGRF